MRRDVPGAKAIIVRAVALSAAIALSPAALAQNAGQSAAPEWKLSTALGPAYPQGKAGEIWAALIRDRSAGRLRAKVYPGATLAQRDPGREFLALRDGTIDLAVGSAANWAAQVKQLNVFALPWLVPDADALDALLRSDVVTALEAPVRAAGVEPLAWAADGFRELATRRPVHAPADLAGLRLRVAPLPLLTETLSTLGAAPASMDVANARSESARGALDGESISVAAYATSRLYASGYARLLLWGAQAEVLLFAINRARWDALSAADRDLVRQAARDAAAQAAALSRRLADTAALADLGRYGVSVTRLTPAGKQPFRAAAKPAYDRWAAVVGEDLVRSAEAVVAAPR
ncbi:MAG TPA: TRAP transporter substrate-binding protein DctP [Casimicrobiaceae bacterium]